MKNRQEKKDNRNPKLSFKNRDRKSLKTSDNLIIISDKKENINNLNSGLKKTIFSSQIKYNLFI